MQVETMFTSAGAAETNVMNRWYGKYVIGLTGNICAGKSEVCALLVELGAYHVDADVVAHDTLVRGRPEFARVVSEFGDSVLNLDGDIDRGRLGEIVFSDAPSLARLEAILHPVIEREIDRRISHADQRVIVLEAIKLLESGLVDDCNAIWVVAAATEERLRRLIARNGLDREPAQQRVDMQATEQEKMEHADVLIDNNSSLHETRAQVRRAWGKIRLSE